mgnify:CR=1 FL=1
MTGRGELALRWARIVSAVGQGGEGGKRRLRHERTRIGTARSYRRARCFRISAMPTAPHRRRASRPSLHRLLCLLVLAFVVRALIPAGFMPQADPAQGGEMALSLCTSTGDMVTMKVDMGRPAPDVPDPSHAHADCAFNMLSHQALTLPPWPVAVASASHARDLAPVADLQAARPPQPAAGPPLGSRAPPPRVG